MACIHDYSKEFRFYVKILFSRSGSASLAEVFYYRSNMSLEFYNRWLWYFEYRAALLRVRNPKSYIKFEGGSYEYTLPIDEYRIKAKNQYLSDKRMLSKFNNQLANARKDWNELFPIEEHPQWKKVMQKQAFYKEKLKYSESEYRKIL